MVHINDGVLEGNVIVPETPRGPLQGVRVIDLTTVMLGPFCTQILGEMGADVIKIEPPGGDIGRWTGAFKTKGMSSAYLMKGRNKRSVVLDLKKNEAKEPLRRLVESADVFVHNIRPKAAVRLGIAYDSIAAIKPDIVYAAATGYGEDGPFVDKPAYDDLIQGASDSQVFSVRLPERRVMVRPCWRIRRPACS